MFGIDDAAEEFITKKAAEFECDVNEVISMFLQEQPQDADGSYIGVAMQIALLRCAVRLGHVISQDIESYDTISNFLYVARSVYLDMIRETEIEDEPT